MDCFLGRDAVVGVGFFNYFLVLRYVSFQYSFPLLQKYAVKGLASNSF